jgi:hypothetical protein
MWCCWCRQWVGCLHIRLHNHTQHHTRKCCAHALHHVICKSWCCQFKPQHTLDCYTISCAGRTQANGSHSLSNSDIAHLTNHTPAQHHKGTSQQSDYINSSDDTQLQYVPANCIVSQHHLARVQEKQTGCRSKLMYQTCASKLHLADSQTASHNTEA